MRYRPYGSYYQPEVDWLDEMPSHWDVRRAKTMLSLQKSKVGRAASHHILLSLTLGGVVPRDISEGGKFPAEFDTYQIVEPDDLVFCLFDIDETPRTIGIARDDGMITGAYSVYRACGPCVAEYACYYFLHLDSFKGLRPFYTGLRKVVRADTFSKVEMPAPPLEEQTQIAKFLDYETAKIDALIEKQRQLITLLKEKRQAVISHVVTKGLNPDAPMRDSGIEWLDEVPAHWSPSKAGRLCTIISKGTTPTQGFVEESEVPFIRVNNLTFSGELSLRDLVFISRPTHQVELARSKVYPGDVLMNIVGPPLGKVSVVSGEYDEYNINQAVAFFRVSGVESSFLSSWLQTSFAQDWFWLRAKKTSGQANLTLEHCRNLPMAVPPRKEQHEIVTALSSRVAKVERTLALATEQVELLQERRTSLISAAVTGKIDVRGWKAPESESIVEVA